MVAVRIELLNGGGWADTGCWIDGHWGQYGPDRLISIAVTQGWELEGDDAALAQIAFTRLDEIGPRGDEAERLVQAFADEHDVLDCDVFTFLVELADEAETWLNDQCPEGFAFGWYDGEFFLQPNEWREETE